MPPKVFYLKINGASVRNVADLRAHFERAGVLEYYRDGRLRRWLDFFPAEADRAARLDALDPDLAEEDLWAALCDVFDAEEAVPPAAPAAVPEPAAVPAPTAESSGDDPLLITAALCIAQLAESVAGYRSLLEKMVDDIDDWGALLADAAMLERDFLPLFDMTSPKVFEMFKSTKALLAIVQREGLWAVWRGMPEISNRLLNDNEMFLLGLASYHASQAEYETVTVHRHFRPLDRVFNVAPVWERVQKRVYSPSAMVDVGEIFVLGFFKRWGYADDYGGIAMRSADEPDTVYKEQDCRFVRLRKPEFSATGEDDALELVYFPVVDGELQFNSAENSPYPHDEDWKKEAKEELAVLFL